MVKRLLLCVLLLSSIVWGAEVPVTTYTQDDSRGTAAFSTSGDFARFQNIKGAFSGTFEIVITGGPASVSIPIVGCAKSGTCHAAVATYIATTTGLQAVTFDSPYDVWKVTPTWTGGTNVTITINIVSSVANSHTGGGGGAWGTITGVLSDQTDLNTALGLKAADSGVVHNTGNETVAGAKTFSSTISGSVNGNAGTATALAANGDNCSGNNFARGVDASGIGECAQPAFSNLSGSVAAGQMPALTGDITTSAGAVATSLASNLLKISCERGLGDGNNGIAAGTYLQTTCKNKTGQTVTLTGITCRTDNAGTSTLNVTNGAGTGLLTGAITCGTSDVAGTQSGTTTIAADDVVKFTFVADGTSKQTDWVIFGTRAR